MATSRSSPTPAPCGEPNRSWGVRCRRVASMRRSISFERIRARSRRSPTPSFAPINGSSPLLQDVLRTVPESYLLADKALYLFSFNKVKEAISPDGVISDAGARTALKVIPTFNPEVKAKEIKLELTYTNEFVKKANAKYK